MNSIKKTLVLLGLICSSMITAQQLPTIDSNGQILYEREVDKYSAVIILSEDLAYNSYDENVQLESLKTTYFKKLTANNFDVSKLKEDVMAYALMSYRKKGIIFRFETNSKAEFLNLITANAQGVQINEKYVYYKPLTDEQISSYAKQAIDQAKKRASLVALATNKKVGDVLSLSSYREELKRGYYSTNDVLEHYFAVTVKFQLL